MPALTLNGNNYFNIEANATRRSDFFCFLKFIWQQYGVTNLGPRNLRFPWQQYFHSVFLTSMFFEILIVLHF